MYQWQQGIRAVAAARFAAGAGHLQGQALKALGQRTRKPYAANEHLETSNLPAAQESKCRARLAIPLPVLYWHTDYVKNVDLRGRWCNQRGDILNLHHHHDLYTFW